MFCLANSQHNFALNLTSHVKFNCSFFVNLNLMMFKWLVVQTNATLKTGFQEETKSLLKKHKPMVKFSYQCQKLFDTKILFYFFFKLNSSTNLNFHCLLKNH